jgi:hypothetical protein
MNGATSLCTDCRADLTDCENCVDGSAFVSLDSALDDHDRAEARREDATAHDATEGDSNARPFEEER